jgi:hypothetical protein
VEDRATLESDPSANAGDHTDGQSNVLCLFFDAHPEVLKAINSPKTNFISAFYLWVNSQL